jgi:Fe-S oxidoreductase
MKEDYICPCRDVDPDNFITNEEVAQLLKSKNNFKFKQKDYYRLYNCIHCGACGTQSERFLLKQKFLEDGNKIEGLRENIATLLNYGTPFKYNKSRIKNIEGINQNSKNLLYFGCFTSVKTPKYGKNIANYLIQRGIDLTILNQETCCGYPILCTGEFDTYEKLVERNKKMFVEKGYEKIITVCPSCYMVFKKEYSTLDIKIEYFTEYLNCSEFKKSGDLVFQHACPLINIEFPDMEKKMTKIYRTSGYNVLNVPHYCCGGGVGHQLRVDIAERIALRRMRDFKIEKTSIKEKNQKTRYITTFCPDAYWILKFYGKKQKIDYQLKDPCDLLI